MSTVWHYLADLHFISFLTFRSAIFETTWLLIADSWSSMQQNTTALTIEVCKVGLCTNPEKCKILTTTVWNDRTDIQATAGADIEKVDDFCYLGSYILHNGSCEKDVRVRIGKATAVFGKMRKIWKNKCIIAVVVVVVTRCNIYLVLWWQHLNCELLIVMYGVFELGYLLFC